MKRIAFLTSSNYQEILSKCPDFIDEFELLTPFFADLNAELVKVNWRDTSVNWQIFDALVPKGCWDYAEHSNEFLDFIKKTDSLEIPMKNNARTVIWNSRKSYLLDLQKQDLPVGELMLIPQNSKSQALDIANILKGSNFNNSPMFVAKPSIGGGAVDTVRFELNDIEMFNPLFEKIQSYADLIIQPYFPEIAQDGEYSYFFFNHKFSHAILKKPAVNDYRAHQLYGGENMSYTPTLTEIQDAFKFVSVIQPACEYARVDVFKRNHVLYLIELELIEPYLYFELASKEAIRSFCEAIVK